MVWFKNDDAFWRHRKIRKLGKDKLPAVGLWQLAGTWCADNTTDGFVPCEQVEEWDPRLRYAKRLVDVALWHEAEHDGEAGYQFHDWAEYQPTKASIEAEREAWRQKKANQRKSTNPGVSPGDTPKDATGTPRESPQGFPVPVPVPSSGSVGGEGYVPARASAPPPPRCPKHATAESPGPCGRCADARRARQTWDTEQADMERAARLAASRCRLCDADGRRWDPTSKARGTVGPCDHKPIPRQEPA